MVDDAPDLGDDNLHFAIDEVKQPPAGVADHSDEPVGGTVVCGQFTGTPVCIAGPDAPSLDAAPPDVLGPELPFAHGLDGGLGVPGREIHSNASFPATRCATKEDRS